MIDNRRRMSFSDWRSVLPSGHPGNSPSTAARAISSRYRRISKARLRRARSKSVGHDTGPSSPPRGISDIEGFRRFAYEYDANKSDHGDLDSRNSVFECSLLSESRRITCSSARSCSFSAGGNDQSSRSNIPLPTKAAPSSTRKGFNGPSTNLVIRRAPRRSQNPAPQIRAPQPLMSHEPAALAIAKRCHRDAKLLRNTRKDSSGSHTQAELIALQQQQLDQLSRVMEGLSVDFGELEKAIRATHDVARQAFDV